MYSDFYSGEITRTAFRLKRKDPAHYFALRKKMDYILANPSHKYKELKYSMKGMKRVHIWHFVLVFKIDHKERKVFFECYDHHDNVYL